MSTKPRIIAPNLIYEVTSKGARNTDIFFTPELKIFFLKELERTLKMFSFHCYAWSIMDDHYHLVLRSSDIPVSVFMQRLNSVYAKRFNKVTHGSGVVFCKRFASIVADDTRLKELVRYVHLNPVRCGNCTIEHIDTYQWCGHRLLIKNDSDHFQNTVDVLKLFFGTDPSKSYNDFFLSGLLECENSSVIENVRNAHHGIENFSKSEPWILGDENFVKKTLEKDLCRRLRIARHIRENITFDTIHESVAMALKIPKSDLYRQGRLNSRTDARNLFAFIGRSHYEFTGASMSNYLGVSGSAVSKMVSRYAMVQSKSLIDDIICKDVHMIKTVVSAVSI
jgi:putative transposase